MRIENMYYSSPYREIINAIESAGNKVREKIMNARHGSKKDPFFIFLINLEPNVNNKAVKGHTIYYY